MHFSTDMELSLLISEINTWTKPVLEWSAPLNVRYHQSQPDVQAMSHQQLQRQPREQQQQQQQQPQQADPFTFGQV